VFRSAGRVFGLIIVKSHRRHDLDHSQRLLAHHGAGQFLAGMYFSDKNAFPKGPVFAMSSCGGWAWSAERQKTPTLDPSAIGLIT